MCQLCVLRGLASETEKEDSIESAAHDLAVAVVSSLFGEEAVKEALENPTKEEDVSEEDREEARELADQIFNTLFGPQALAQVHKARAAESKGLDPEFVAKVFTEASSQDKPRHEQAESFADRIFAAMHGEDALAEVKASADVQAFLASKRGTKEKPSSKARMGSVGEPPKSAADFLDAAKRHMDNRAVTYDNPEGERSMAKTVELFNTLRDQNLTEADGWTFMALLKMVRANQGAFKSDNFEDLVAYAALLGESEVKAA